MKRADTSSNPDRYRPISDYGIIGDQHSAALVSKNGSVDWCCLPRFDSPSLFGALIDRDRGGTFSVTPLAGPYKTLQYYEPDTNVLTTVFRTSKGTLQLTDFMPCYMDRGEFVAFHEIHRVVRARGGAVNVRVEFNPRFNYGTDETRLLATDHGYSGTNGKDWVTFSSTGRLDAALSDRLVAVMELPQNRTGAIVARWGREENSPEQPRLMGESKTKLSRTLYFWKNWVGHIKYTGRWRRQVVRSALVIKLLNYAPTGALVAAATTSLPESLGGVRNWDYRYSWVRDSAFSLWALSNLGLTRESLDYVRWLMTTGMSSQLQIMRGIEGETRLDEYAIDGLEGYKQSHPVRIGNDAHKQLQLDIYGAFIDSIYYLHTVLGWTAKETYEGIVKKLADFAAEAWKIPDSGIWEFRGKPKMLTESRVWCYVALDRAIKLAEEMGYWEDAASWRPVREKIKQEILTRGWSEKKKSFTMTFGGTSLDAANLLMPLVEFLPANHPYVRATVQRTVEELSDGPLVYRYRVEDGLPGREGAFTVCSFWLVDCYTRMGKIKRAHDLFRQLLGYANHVGLYSEEIEPSTGEALGNFPQAYTHMGLISSAVHLDKAIRKKRRAQH